MAGKSHLVQEPHLFQRLKPVCVNVTKECSVEHLNEAIKVLKSLQRYDINEIAMLEYVLFPFRITLQKKKILKEEQEILCYQCLQIIFSKCHSSVIRDEIISWCLNTFSLYFASRHLNQNIEQKGPLVNNDISEERKLDLVKLVQSMFINVNSGSMTTLYQDKFMPVIGHVLSILLNMVESEKNQELQVGAVMCLRTLSGFSVKDKKCTELAGKYWASFLPGICTSFNRLFTLKSNISQNMMSISLDTFSYIIYVVMNDDLNCNLLSEDLTLEQLFTSKLPNTDTKTCINKISETTDPKQLGIKRDREWLEKTSMHMNIVFKNILPIVMCNTKTKVKMALLAFIERLLLTCMKSLASSLMDFLDVLLKHSCDESEEVKNEAKRMLSKSVDRFQDKKLKHVQSALNERLYNELISLPRVMNSSNEEMKLTKLQVIKGYMDFYGQNMREALNTHSLLERFIMSLIHILELDTTDVNLVEKQTSIFRQAIDIGTETYDNRFYRKNFKFFRNITIHNLIKETIHLLAKYGNIDLIVDYLIEQGLNSSLLRNQSFLILNEILLGLNKEHTDNISSIIELILSTYVDDRLLKLPVSNTPICKKDNVFDSDDYIITKQKKMNQDNYIRNTIPFEILNSNIQLVCILLEGVSNCAEVLKTDFNICLMQTLYPILEKVGSTNAAVSSSAIETLNNIVRFCNYEDINNFIFLNSDYLLNSITLQFRRLTHGSAAPAVLCVVLRFCDSSLIPIMYNVIEDVFGVLDEYGEEVASDMLLVLRHYNIAVDKCYNGITQKTEIEQKSNFRKRNIERELTDIYNDDVSVSSFVDEYYKVTMHAQGNINEEDYIDADIDGENLKHVNEDFEDKEEISGNSEDVACGEEDVKEETPFHYKVVITSLEKCVAFTAAHEDILRLNALDVVLHGIYALRERENDLLPLIHKLWPPIICRLKDNEYVLVLKAFDVVCAMVEYSGNFMTKRMTSDFLPYAIQFLQDHCKTANTECIFTQTFKINKKLISFLGDVVPQLDPSRELFCNISSAIILYTNCNFHLSLQETAVSALSKFYTYKPNVVWLLCQCMYPSSHWMPTSTCFNPVNFTNSESDANQYRDNILKLQSIMAGESVVT